MAMTQLPLGVITAVAAGFYYFPMAPNGGATIQVLASSSLKFKVWGSNDPSLAQASVSAVPVGQTNQSDGLGVVSQNPGSELTLAQYDLVDIVFGGVLYAVIEVTSGSGSISAVACPGQKNF